MAKLRKAICWRRLERPYTRFSKYKKHNFVRARPVNRVVSFNMGDSKKTYGYTLHLISKTDIQIRDNAIESARQTGNRALEKRLGKGQYYYMTRVFPHHILRENPLAAGAGADRMSTGMARSFGKPVGRAARVHAGQAVFTAMVKKEHLETGRLALKRAAGKLPCGCRVEIQKWTGLKL